MKRGTGERGTVHIRERANGTWEARFTGRDSMGRPVRRSLYGKNKVEVRTRAVRAMVDTEDGRAAAGGERSLRAYLERWLSEKADHLRPSTQLRYQGIVEKNLIPGLGHLRLREVTPGHVNAFLKSNQGDVSPRTRLHFRAVLRTALNDALRERLVTINAAALARPPKVDKPQVTPMTPAEARAILSATKGTDVEAVVATGLLTGLRLGEVLGLRWHDVDLDRGELRVTGIVQRLQGVTRRLETTKTSGSVRSIAIPPPLRDVLRAHKARQALAADPNTWDPLIPGLIFTTPLGDPLVPSTVSHAFQRVLRHANLPQRRFHDLRHGTATLLLSLGVPLKIVSEILGHSSITITADTYASVLPALNQDAMERLGALLRSDA